MTRRAKPKRDKAYRPKHIAVPVMPELQREFMFASHGALAALRLAPNIEALCQLAATFNVIAVALADIGGANLVLESGMRALQDVVDRVERLGAVGIGRYELAPIENAVIECETIVKGLDIIGLYVADQKILQAARIDRLLKLAPPNQPSRD